MIARAMRSRAEAGRAPEAEPAGACAAAATLAEPLAAGPALHLTLPAQPDSIAAVRAALRTRGEALGIARSLLADICLAVTEACTNVVLHAYPGGREGPLEVVVWVSPPEASERALTVVVRDSGRGLARAREESPGTSEEAAGERLGLGLGLQLMGSLATTFSLGQDHRGHTEVTMGFPLAPLRTSSKGPDTMPLGTRGESPASEDGKARALREDARSRA
jgi:anti-sigma regulatory factor (Ser/Thr protein kinase)